MGAPEDEVLQAAERLLADLDGMTGVNQRTLLLRRAEQAGWFSYDAMGGQAPNTWVHLTLPDGRRRVLRADEVMPWLLGFADRVGEPERVAYRRGLVGEVGAG